MWAILIGTTVWVAYDAHKYKIAVNKKPYSLNNGAVAWALSCVVLWIGFFPYYLIHRSKILKSRAVKPQGDVKVDCALCGQHLEVPQEMLGQIAQCPSCQREFCIPSAVKTDQLTANPTLTTVVGFIVFAIQCALLILMFTGDIKMSTADLQTQVEESIRAKLAKEPATAEIQVKLLALVHKNGNQYEGIVEISAGGETKQFTVDVTYDGKQFMWQIRR